MGNIPSRDCRHVLPGTSSLPSGSATILEATRAHWGIENNLHWQLYITFDEDHCRTRKDFPPRVPVIGPASSVRFLRFYEI